MKTTNFGNYSYLPVHLFSRSCKLYFVLLMKSHIKSYPCPLQINYFWNLGFLLGITIILQTPIKKMKKENSFRNENEKEWINN